MHLNQSLVILISLTTSKNTWLSAAFPYIYGRRKAAKIWNKNSSSKSAPLILTVLMNAFHLTNIFLYSRCHVTTNSIAPTLLYKLSVTHNSSIRSDEGLTLETSAFRISVRWPIYIINSVDKTKFNTVSIMVGGKIPH